MRKMLAGAWIFCALLFGEEDPQSKKVDAIFKSYGDKTPGCAVMVIQNGKIIHQAGYGMADLERGKKLGPKTAMRLGSVGKQFTAMGIMILAHKGLLDFDDPASKHIPELKKRYSEKITIRHLLNHTSGLPDYYGAMDQFPKDRMPLTQDGAKVFEKWGKPRFEPNERYEYSNPGYEMLGVIIERVSKKSFAAFMKEEIFDPLEMTGSLVMDQPEKHFPSRAYGYSKGLFKTRLNDDHHLNLMFGAGGVYSTLEDMYKWDQALYTDKLVKQSIMDQAFTPAKLNNNKKTNYGFGWVVGFHKGHYCLSHNGDWVGFRAGIARYVKARLTIVVLSNRSDFKTGSHIKAIADIYLEPQKTKEGPVKH